MPLAMVDGTRRHPRILHLGDNLDLGGFVCAIGVFDGLHEGHRYIIEQTRAQARQLGLPAIAITFDRDPDELFLDPSQQRKLLENKDRIAFLAQSGVDAVLVIPFDEGLSQLEPQDFLDAVIAAHGSPKGIHVGADFRFGKKARGSVHDLKLWGDEHSCEIHAHELLFDEGLLVTSTRIRNALQQGDIVLANKMLTRPYFLWARVVQGRNAGRELGFPTANLMIEEHLVCPADGVYACAVVMGDTVHKAATSVGIPATFAGAASTIEAHILDFDGDLYGHRLQIFFLSYLRPMKGFETVEELQRTVFENIEQARETVIPQELYSCLRL